MKIFLEILLLAIIIVILFFLFFSYAKISLSPSFQKGYVCIKPFDAAQNRENCFSVEIAKTETQREKGLMDRKELDKDKGMLFIFEKEGIYPFWMKNTLIPLDIIWINSNNKVVFFSQNVQPCKSLICPSVVPSTKAKYVLEVNAGISEKIGLKIGDESNINY